MLERIKKYLKKNWPIFLFLTFLVFIAYANSLNNELLSDDIGAITENPDIGNLSSIFSKPYNFFQPLQYYFIYKICGFAPICYRVSNILFHLGGVFTVYIIVSLLFGKDLAFYVAAIFSVHPILIESVGWVSGGPYVKYGFFLLASFLTYILSDKYKKLYFLSFIFAALALVCSEKAMVYFIILFTYELALGNLKKNWKKIIPFFLIDSIWFFIYVVQIPSRQASVMQSDSAEKKYGDILIQIPIALTSYLQLIFWPDKLTLYHSEMIFGMKEYLIRVAFSICFVGFIIYSFFKNRKIFFWLSFFIISLLPTLTPFRISWIVAERYVYLGSIGIFVVFGYFLKKLVDNKKTESFGYLLFIIIILCLTTRTIIRNVDWRNQNNLWIATAKTSPSDPKTHLNLGDVYGRAGDFEKSAQEFITAIKLYPNYAAAYHNLGNTYINMGKKEMALNSYLLAIKYDPSIWQSYQNIASIYFNQGEIASCEAFLKMALKINPSNDDLYVDLAMVSLKKQDKAKAKQYLEKALKINPANEQAKEMLISL